jgi:hypothetical protein
MDDRTRRVQAIEYRKRQILKMNPDELLKLIVEKFDLENNTEEFEAIMRDGLYEAVRTQPSIAKVICPRLAQPIDERLARLFLELMYDLWTVDMPLLVKLFNELRASASQEVESEIRNVLIAYRQDFMEAGSKSRQFIAFLNKQGWK